MTYRVGGHNRCIVHYGPCALTLALQSYMLDELLLEDGIGLKSRSKEATYRLHAVIQELQEEDHMQTSNYMSCSSTSEKDQSR